MSIEDLIAENTAAVLALTAAIRELTARSVTGSRASAPVASAPVASAPVASAPVAQEPRTIPAGYGPASPADTEIAVASASASAPLEPLQPVAPAPAPAPADVQAPQVAVPENLEGMRALCIKAGELGLTADIVAFLRGRNVSMLRDLPQADWGALVSFLKSKGVQ